MAWKKLPMTKEAKGEIPEKQTKLDSLYRQYPKAPSWKRGSLAGAAARVSDKISEIEKLGVSSKQLSALKKESFSMKNVHYEKDLFYREKIVEGFSKTLGRDVRLHMSKGGTRIHSMGYDIDLIEVRA